MTSETATKRSWRSWVSRLAPWVITAVVVTALLRQYSLSRVIAELGKGDFLAAAPVFGVLLVIQLLGAALWDWVVMKGTLGGPGYWDVVRGKAATTVLGNLSYTIGHGGYIAWIARRNRVKVSEATGVMAFVITSDLLAIAIAFAIGVAVGGDKIPESARWLGTLPTLTLIVVALAAAAIAPTILKKGWKFPGLLAPWWRMSRARIFAGLLGRCTTPLFFAGATYFAASAWGMPLPLWAVASYFPLVLLVGALPINIGGLGAVQACWLLFSPWASGAKILAFAFVWSLSIGGGVTIRGLPFLRRVITEIARGGDARADGLERGGTGDELAAVAVDPVRAGAACEE